MIVADDRRLSPAEIEATTGIEAQHYRAQANKLRREGIKCIVNARKEVVVWLSWVQAAAMPPPVIQSPARADNDENITLDLSSLRNRRRGTKRQSR